MTRSRQATLASGFSCPVGPGTDRSGPTGTGSVACACPCLHSRFRCYSVSAYQVFVRVFLKKEKKFLSECHVVDSAALQTAAELQLEKTGSQHCRQHLVMAKLFRPGRHVNQCKDAGRQRYQSMLGENTRKLRSDNDNSISKLKLKRV